MNEAEERFLRVAIGYLAAHTRTLANAVSVLNAAIKEGAAPQIAALLAQMDKDLLEMDASLTRIQEAFPPEQPGGFTGNGGRLH